MEVQQIVNKQWAPLFQKPSGIRYVILMGGRGAGRSFVASQYALARLIAPEYFRCAIMRLIHGDIRNSIWQEIMDRINAAGVENQFNITTNDMKITYSANSLNAMGFKTSSGSQSAKLKSLANYNTVIIEEAEEIGEAEFMQLDDSLRTVKGDITVVLLCNPPSKAHWLVRRFFHLTEAPVSGFYTPTLSERHKDDTLLLWHNYEVNLSHLDTHTVKRYEGYLQTNPAYYWQMVRGYVPEVVMGRIYEGWQEIEAVPHEARLLGFGLDLGFANDEAAIVAVYYHNGGYIAEEKLYTVGMTNMDLANYLKLQAPVPIVIDSAEPKSIEELKQLGVTNIIPVEKGKGSVEYGVKHLQGLRMSYTSTSPNLKIEYENYAWKTNKDGTDLPVVDQSCADHLLDALRYFCMEMVKVNVTPESQFLETLMHQEELAKDNLTITQRFSL